jgi:hypothetical protein
MLRWPGRSYSARYTVILITSRDCSHITWFRNSASVSLLATLSHRTWIANDFFIISTFSKAIENLRLHFLKIFLQTKISFSLISCMRSRHSTVIQDYIRRDDVIRCELDLVLTITAAKLDIFHRSLSRDALVSSHRSLPRNVFIEREAIRFLERHEIERTCLWSVI